MRKQSSPLESSDLAIFARVVELRSFSAAARATGTTTGAASKRVARLEERLGARLFERTTRRVLPTEAGAAFYARVTRILSDVDEAENEIATLGGEPRGTLRISAPVILGERHLAALLPPFLLRHPELRIDLSLGDHFVNLVADRIDVALRVGALADSSLVKKRVGVVASLVVAAPSYLERAGRPETPIDLARHNCVRYSRIIAAREWRFMRRGKVVSVPVVGNLEVDHGGAMREAVLAGVGIARLPDFLVADGLREGRLVPLLEEYALPPNGIHLVYPSGAAPMPKVQAFVEEIGDALKARLATMHGVSTRVRRCDAARALR
jgi:DNA-binding transcriptional LysR family regulator